MNNTGTATKAIGVGYFTYRYEHDLQPARDEYTWDASPGWREWSPWVFDANTLTFDFTTTPPSIR